LVILKECKEKAGTLTMEGIRKIGRPRKRRRDEVTEDLSISGINSRKEVTERAKNG
jgi:hypothetical protein